VGGKLEDQQDHKEQHLYPWVLVPCQRRDCGVENPRAKGFASGHDFKSGRIMPKQNGLYKLRKDTTKVPKGRLKGAQDEVLDSVSRPFGTTRLAYNFPGLTSRATFSLPSGTFAEFSQPLQPLVLLFLARFWDLYATTSTLGLAEL
jgi:hypothetical protein